MLRRRRPSDPLAHVDAARLPPRWQRPVTEALAARARYQELVGRLRGGPLRDRMQELGARVDSGVLAVWEAAVEAADLSEVVAAIDVDDVSASHKQALRDVAAARQRGPVDPDLERRSQLLAARHASVQRLLNGLEQTEQRLASLDVRLDAIVTRVAEVAFDPASAGAVGEAVGVELDAVVAELGDLRQALRGLDGP